MTQVSVRQAKRRSKRIENSRRRTWWAVLTHQARSYAVSDAEKKLGGEDAAEDKAFAADKVTLTRLLAPTILLCTSINTRRTSSRQSRQHVVCGPFAAATALDGCLPAEDQTFRI